MRNTLLLLLVLATVPVLHAGEKSGASAVPILKIPVGARAAAMGGAFTGVADDISTLFYNPAGLSNMDHKEISFMYQRGIEGQNVEYIAAGAPINYSGLIGEGFTSVGASLLFAQHGTIEVNRTKADGSFLNTENLNAGGDLIFTMGYSERAGEMEFGSGGERIRLQHTVGFSGKIIRSTLVQQYQATAVAGDLGYHLKIPEAKFSYGLSVLNLGTEMRFVEDSDPLPMTVRTGLAYEPPLSARLNLSEHQKLLLATDFDFLVIEEQWHLNLGLEYSPLKGASMRLGYQVNRGVSGLTFGLGTDVRGTRVEYGWAMNSSLSDLHRISITYAFGKVPGYKREFQRRPYIESMPESDEMGDIEEETPREVAPKRRPRRVPDNRRTAPGWIY